MPCPKTFLLSCVAAGDLLFTFVAETNYVFLDHWFKGPSASVLLAIERYLAILKSFHEISRAKTLLIILAFSAMV